MTTGSPSAAQAPSVEGPPVAVGGAASGLSQGWLRPEVVMLAGGLRPASLKMVSLRSGWLRKGEEERALALGTGSRSVIVSPLGNDCGQVGTLSPAPPPAWKRGQMPLGQGARRLCVTARPAKAPSCPDRTLGVRNVSDLGLDSALNLHLASTTCQREKGVWWGWGVPLGQWAM